MSPASKTFASSTLPAPVDFGARSVELMLTSACNYRCAYCTQSRKSARVMAPEVLDEGIRRLVSSFYARPELVLFGGEPLLAPSLVRRALDRVRDWAPTHMRPDVQIVTNGSRLGDEMIRLLVSRDVRIGLSFDGVAPAQDQRRPGTFPLLDALLVRLRREHPVHFRNRVSVQVTLSASNMPHLAESFRYFLSRGVRDVQVYPVLPDDPGWNERSPRELGPQLACVVRASLGEFRRTGRVPLRAFRGGAARMPSPTAPPCGCGSRSALFVDVDGMLAPCSRLAASTLSASSAPLRPVVRLLRGPHVSDPTLDAALARRERRARRSPFLAGIGSRRAPRGSCADCPARSTCFVCPVALACNGGRVPRFHCDVNWLFARHRAAFLRGAASA